MRCPNIVKKIGEGKANITKDFNEGVFQPSVVSSVIYNADSIEIKFYVRIFKGGVAPGGGPYIFDYYFATAGKNVDVLAYDVKMHDLHVFLAYTSKQCVDKYTNAMGTMVDKIELGKINHENVTQERLNETVEKTKVSGKSGDIAKLSANGSILDQNGHNIYSFKDVPGVKLASAALQDWCTSINMSPMMEIRGHLDILKVCISKPDGIAGLLSV
jgi:hypothetical protein